MHALDNGLDNQSISQLFKLSFLAGLCYSAQLWVAAAASFA
jgi:hypothetical protein